MANKEDAIYHYCSLDTFVQIMNNKTLRLCDLSKTNDSLEKIWGMRLVEDALVQELEANKIALNLKEDYWYGDSVHNHLEQLQEELRMQLEHLTLIACFSKERDKLSQWRAYGNDGKGIAIGFNYKLLKSLLKGQKNISIGDVIYKKEKQIKEIKEKIYTPAVYYMREMFKRDEVKLSKDFNEYFAEEFDCFCEVLDVSTERVFSYFKNPAFEEEKEVRIVYKSMLRGDMEYNDLKAGLSYINKIERPNCFVEVQPIRMQVRGDKLVAYADLDFTDCVHKGIINEIVVGPKAQVSESDVRQLLCSLGWDYIFVDTSEASYR